MSLEIKHHSLDPNSWVLVPEGSLDSFTADKLENEVVNLLDNHTQYILLDMAKVDYISSVGLGTIIKLIKRAKDANSNLTLYDSQQAVQKVLEIAKLGFLQIDADSIDSANPFLNYIQAQEVERRKKREAQERSTEKQNWLKKKKSE